MVQNKWEEGNGIKDTWQENESVKVGCKKSKMSLKWKGELSSKFKQWM